MCLNYPFGLIEVLFLLVSNAVICFPPYLSRRAVNVGVCFPSSRLVMKVGLVISLRMARPLDGVNRM